MVLRRLHSAMNANDGPRPARGSVMETEKVISPPYGVVLQSLHSRLAGDLAARLRPEVLGQIPGEVVEAARQHDLGWTESDMQQLEYLGTRPLQPFCTVPEETEIASWQNSLQRTAGATPLIPILISRHFCLLSSDSPLHQEFLQRETRRREREENTTLYSAEDLNRWTAVIGFCDLLSLYLCCGLTEEAEFPLSHPADPTAAHAPTVVLSWKDGAPRFIPPVLEPGTFRIETKMYAGGTDLQEQPVEWTFHEG